MKVYNRQDFLQLPAGVVYAKGKPWAFEQLNQKHETIMHDGKAIDFIYLELVNIENDGSDDYFSRLYGMLERGESYPFDPEMTGRDGCFDDREVFLVFEAEDLRRLTAIIGSARAP